MRIFNISSTARCRVRAGAGVFALAALIAGFGCSRGEQPALSVAGIHFERTQIQDLTAEQLEELADLATLGRVVADGTIDSLAAPLARRERERSRLQALPYHLGALRMGMGDDALRSAYHDDPAWELTVRHIVRLVPRWASTSERAAARAIAEEAERRARDGSDFGRLAAAFSEEPGAAERGGLLQPGTTGSWVEPFWSAALRLERGEVSGVVETEYGYHVILLEDRQPVPYSEAPALPLLRRLIPRATAMLAMEEWAATRPPITLDQGAVEQAWEVVLRGRHPPPTPLAHSQGGAVYTGHDLVLSWVSLAPDQRETITASGSAALINWVETDAREALWADEAGERGGNIVAAEQMENAWIGRIERAAAAVGFRVALSDQRIASTSLSAIADRGQEARIARSQIAALRPLLRSAYPPLGSLTLSSSSEDSSSERRNSENTR
ncbi:hypothetical protein BH23GEM6_BH23GEM6_25600 [soil metagenome]